MGAEIKSSWRIRRARTLLVAWQERALVLTNYQTQVSASADPEAVRILHLLEDWAHPSELFQLLPEYSPKSILAGIRELLDHTFIVRQGTPEAARDADLEHVWSDWLPHGSFHFGTKDVHFLSRAEASQLFKRFLEESSQPPSVKSYPKAAHIRLAKEQTPGDEFTRVLAARRTHRQFSEQP